MKKRSKRRSVRRRTSTPVRRSRRRGGMLSGGMSGIKPAVINTGKGLLGGILYSFIAKMVDKDNTKPDTRLMAGIAASIAISAFLKQPAIGAGLAGSFGSSLAAKFGLLQDEGEEMQYVPDTLLSNQALNQYLDLGGRNSMNLSDGNDTYFQLSDGSFAKVYPGYNNPGFYDKNN